MFILKKIFNILSNEKKILNIINNAINISSNPKNKQRKKISLLLKYEKKNNLYNLETSFFAWDYLRIHLNTLIENYENKKVVYRKFFDEISHLFLYKNLSYLPFFLPTKKVDYIFFGHPRGELKSNNLLNDEYMDHFITNFSSSKKKIIFGYPHIKYGTSYNYINKRFYIHWIYLIIKIFAFFKFFLFRINTFYPHQLRKIGLNIFIAINKEKWWINYLKKTKPKVIFIVDISSNLSILRAANKLGVVTCEVQHGSPDYNKFPYNFYTKNRLSIPTHYISWGSFWKTGLINYYKRKYFVMGKNLDKKIPLCKKKNKNMLVIDQRIGRTTLINKAIQIKKNNKDLNICYRFHPSISDISEDIDLLRKNNIKISNPFKKELRDDLKNVRYILAHSSTAIYELAQSNYDICIVKSEINMDGLMNNINKLFAKKKKFGLLTIDTKKIKFIEKLNYDFLNDL